MVWRLLPLILVLVVPTAVAAAVMIEGGWVAVAVLAVLGLLLVVPARWLPALGLLLFVSPFGYGVTQPWLYQLAPLPVALVIYLVRRHAALDLRGGLLGGGIAVLLIGLLSAFGGLDLRNSVLFLGAAAVLIFVPIAVRGVPSEDHVLLVRVWAGCAIALAGFALVEFAVGANLLAGWYAASDYPLEQKWESYRVLTTIGHPLLNGVFFATSFAMFCWQLVDRTALRRSVVVVGLVASLGGVALSESRSALVAAAVGGGLVTLTSSKRLRSASLLWALRIVLPVGIAAAFGYIATGRLGGIEAQESALSRQAVYSSFDTLVAGRELLGAGPGNAGAQNTMFGAFPDLPLESAALELLVSWGYVGTAALLVLTVAYVVAVVRRGRLASLAPAAAMTTAALFFNLVEGDPKVMLLVCAVLLVTATPAEPVPTPGRTQRIPAVGVG